MTGVPSGGLASMIEVVRIGDLWTWTIIGLCGRVLVYTAERFASDHAANDAAKAFRSAFWRIAAELDHRMGACR